jgi:predicted glycosyltransferase
MLQFAATTKRPPIIFYCQVAYGVGHWMRTAALLSALRHQFETTLLLGGRFSDDLSIPDGIDVVHLPVKFRDADDQIVALDTSLTLQQINARRGRMITEVVHRVKPVAVLMEYFPFGRWEVWSDVLHLVETAKYPLLARKETMPLVFCSVRDIGQTKRPYQELFDARACELANMLLDGIFVHSDPEFAKFEDTFQAAESLEVPLFHTGYVVPQDEEATAGEPHRDPLILVSAGGGLGGESLLLLAVEAFRDTDLNRDYRMRVIAGVFQPEAVWEHLKAMADGVERLEIVRWTPNLRQELSRASVSVSRCGYNTALDVLRSDTPGLFVPYATPIEDEQTIRAKKLANLGVARCLPEEEASLGRLASEIRQTAIFKPERPRLDMNGASRTTDLLLRLLQQRTLTGQLSVASAYAGVN